MINYIIATFSGQIESRKNREESEKVLAIQLNELKKIFIKKKKQNIKNYISQITIIVPECKIPIYKNYYDTGLTKIEDIPIVYINYIGDNKDHSYDQWLQGIINNINFEYYLLIEDDYCIDSNNIFFDKELIDIYNNSFELNKGYLSTLVWEKPILHAAISNGFISKKTVEYMNDLCNLNILNEYYKLSGYPQLKFSQLFNNFNIPHKDLTNNNIILFWDSPSQKIKDFSNDDKKREEKNLIFIPIQYIYDISISNYSNITSLEIYKNIKS